MNIDLVGLIVAVVCILAFAWFGFTADSRGNKLAVRVAELKTELKICKSHKEANWNNYQACRGELEKRKERKPLTERLKNLTLQDVVEDVQEIDRMVKAFVKKQRRP